MKIYNIKEKQEYLKEVATLEYEEWASNKNIDKEKRIAKKIEKIKNNLSKNDFCKLILLEENTLIGFISIFPIDCEELEYLTPWYATMYIKKEYRSQGYSKILNEAILKEAKNRNFKKIYLKTTLNNYYEKFGAQYLKNTSKFEKIYYFNLIEK